MLYRVAIQTKSVPPRWQWTSTPLSSLNAVLGFLQMYRALPQDRLRVFSSASRQDLGEQFRGEQGGLGMHSVTAAQFMRDRLLSSGDATREMSEQETPQNQAAGFGTIVPSLSVHESSKRTYAQAGGSKLDCKRVEIEHGAGGDHDLPYHFAFPPTWPQVRAWIELLAQVQCGELQP